MLMNSKEKKLSWKPMRIDLIGSVSQVVLQGGGKLTADVGDPGEPRKVPSTG